MIPALQKFLSEKNPGTRPEDFSLIKLHNGYSYTNPKVSFVGFKYERPVIFLKTVRKPKEQKVIEEAHKNLAKANMAARQIQCSFILPQAEWCDSLQNVSVAAETVLEGRPLRAGSKKEVQQALDALLLWYQGLPKAVEVFSDDALRVLCQRLCQDLGWDSTEFSALLERALAKVNAQALRLPHVPAHGDLTPSNMLVRSDGRLGVIDWDRFGEIEIPLFDFFTFIERVTQKGENPFVVHRTTFYYFMETLQLDVSLAPAMIFFYALYSAWRKRDRLAQVNQSLLTNFHQVIAWAQGVQSW